MNNYVRRNGAYDGFVWGDLFDSFEKTMDTIFSVPTRQISSITSNNFPPSNILISKDTKDLKIQCALAGYKKEDIFVEFDDDNLKITIDREGKVNESEKYIQQGIRLPDSAQINFKIDTRFYDSSSAKVLFEDGLLEIQISPLDAVKPRKIPLFGEPKKKEIEAPAQ